MSCARFRRLLVGLGAALLMIPAARAALVETQRSIREAAIDPARARAIGRLRLASGPGFLEIRSGMVYPAIGSDGAIAEIVFVGRARFVLAPANRVEKEQLELFTGGQALDETILEGVIVVASDEARRALLRGSPLPELDEKSTARAQEIYGNWRARPERRRLQIEAAMTKDRIEGESFEGYFAAWLHGETVGNFVYLVDPDQREPVTAIQFTPAEITALERQGAIDEIRRDQKKGRYIGIEPDDLLGQWDVWVSTNLRGSGGQPRPGVEPFEPESYAIEAEIEKFPLELAAKTRIRARARVGGRSLVPIDVSEDLTVVATEDAEGRPLESVRDGNALLVQLPRAPEAGETIEMVVRTTGRIIEDTGQGSYALRDTSGWHARLDAEGDATFDVTIVHPKSLDVLASGRPVDAGERDGKAFVHNVLDIPTYGFTFEVGKFRVETRQVGHVTLSVAFDTVTKMYSDLPRDAIVDAAAQTFQFYEETFGPYPLDRMTIVTANRGFSQGLLSFLTLSTGELALEDDIRRFSNVRDPRTVVAHEIAHQWWGNIVGWDSYRDQWISEAMATYASNLFARRRMTFGGKSEVRISQTALWWRDVQEITDRGIPTDALGPVVLGTRLESSLHEGAYHAIVYVKGAVVLETLSRYFATENLFLDALRAIVDEARGHRISTEDFLAILGRHAAIDPTPFANRFIYGTGLPSIVYRYHIAPTDSGRWSVSGTARKLEPFKFRFRVTRLPDGGFDLRREAEPLMQLGDFPLVIPMQIGIVQDDAPPPKKNASTTLDRSNATVDGKLVLGGDDRDFDIRVSHSAVGAWLDLNRESYVLCYDETAFAKKADYVLGLDAWAKGSIEEARGFFEKALADPVEVPDDRPRVGAEREYEKQQLRIFDVKAAAALAAIHMDAGDLDAAGRAVDRATSTDGYLVKMAGLEMLLANSRYRILRGDPSAALKSLKREIFAPVRLRTFFAGRSKGNRELFREEREGPLKDPEAYALAAIAAKMSGDRETFETTLRLARKFGVDVTALED